MMEVNDLMKAIRERHSVRSYTEKPIDGNVKMELLSYIEQCNEESGLHMQLGLNTCWVAMTYSKVKTAFSVENGEKLCLVIAIGYGETNGTEHKIKQPEAVMKTDRPAPKWFEKGIEAALLAPTAMNQQKFCFVLNGNSVIAKVGTGFYTKIDLGIAKCHFEIGAGKDNFGWEG